MCCNFDSRKLCAAVANWDRHIEEFDARDNIEFQKWLDKFTKHELISFLDQGLSRGELHEVFELEVYGVESCQT